MLPSLHPAKQLKPIKEHLRQQAEGHCKPSAASPALLSAAWLLPLVFLVSASSFSSTPLSRQPHNLPEGGPSLHHCSSASAQWEQPSNHSSPDQGQRQHYLPHSGPDSAKPQSLKHEPSGNAQLLTPLASLLLLHFLLRSPRGLTPCFPIPCQHCSPDLPLQGTTPLPRVSSCNPVAGWAPALPAPQPN